MRTRIDCHGVTDVGRQRDSNQDHFLIADLNKSMLVHATSLALDQQDRLYGGSQGRLMMVADGMGGHAGGERASSLALDFLIERLLNSVHWFFQLDRDDEEHFLDDLKRLLRETHRKIQREGNRRSDNKGMGTTLTLAYAIWPNLYILHAGDSRAYLIRGGEAEQLTVDHTMARKLVDSGGLRPEDAAKSRWSNVLWNVLGGNGHDLTAEVRKCELQAGDRVLLCSDGLYHHLDDKEIFQIVSNSRSAHEACERLVDTANKAGGSDNITVVVAAFSQPEDRRPRTTIETEVPLRQVLDGDSAADTSDTADTADTAG